MMMMINDNQGEDGVYFRLRSGTVRLETTAFRNESGLSLTALDPEEFISRWTSQTISSHTIFVA